MATINEIYQEIASACFEYKNATSMGARVSAAKERVKNLLFNHREDILNSLQSAGVLQREIDMLKERCTTLEDELAAVDDENNELRRKIRDLEATESPKRRKAKTTDVETKVLTAVVK